MAHSGCRCLCTRFCFNRELVHFRIDISGQHNPSREIIRIKARPGRVNICINHRHSSLVYPLLRTMGNRIVQLRCLDCIMGNDRIIHIYRRGLLVEQEPASPGDLSIWYRKISSLVIGVYIPGYPGIVRDNHKKFNRYIVK